MIKKIKNPLIEKSRFLITPEPFEGEIFSSWLARCAYAHKTHPKTFCNLHLPKDKYIYTITPNFDATISDKVLEVLVRKTGFTMAKLKAMTMQSYNGYLQEEIIRNGMNKFLTAYRFCPKCWQEDKIPYIRKEHRVIFSTFCKKHKCYLHDKCPKCQTPIAAFKMFKNELTYNFCNKCGFDLSETPIEYIKDKTMYDLNCKLLNVLEKGYIELGSFYIYSFFFFEVISHVLGLILLRKKYLLHLKNKKQLEDICEQTFSKKNSSYSQLSIAEQYLLYGLMMDIFEGFPTNFKKYMQDNELSNYDMVKDMCMVPYWYEVAINAISPKIEYCARRVTQEEIHNAIHYLKTHNMDINQANLTRLLDCNFFSSYNQLKSFILDKPIFDT